MPSGTCAQDTTSEVSLQASSNNVQARLAGMALSTDAHWRLGLTPGFIQQDPTCIAPYGQQLSRHCMSAMLPDWISRTLMEKKPFVWQREKNTG